MPRNDPVSSLYGCLNWKTQKEVASSLQSNNYARIYSIRLKGSWYSSSLMLELAENSKVAMKMITRGTERLRHTEICKKEFDHLKKLTHENIVMVFDVNLRIDPNDPFSLPSYLMEIGECSLSFIFHFKNETSFVVPTPAANEERGKDIRFYTKDHLFTWLYQVACALTYLHEKGLLHRDVKGTNALLFNNKTLCKLCDFDTCREIDSTGMTPKVGTNRWRAPELRKPSRDSNAVQYSRPADCYSFGVLLCEGIFREVPFRGYPDSTFDKCDGDIPDVSEQDTGGLYIRKGLDGALPNVVVVRDKSVFVDLPDELWTHLEDLLSWKPEDRPHIADIREYLGRLEKGKNLPMIIVRKPQKTDTGSEFNERVNNRRSEVLTRRITYSTSVQLSVSGQDRVRGVLHDFSRNISVLASVPDDKLGGIRHEFSLDDSVLTHDIKCTDQLLVNKVYDYCYTDHERKFSSWLGSLFVCDSIPELRRIRFQVIPEVQRVEE